MLAAQGCLSLDDLKIKPADAGADDSEDDAQQSEDAGPDDAALYTGSGDDVVDSGCHPGVPEGSSCDSPDNEPPVAIDSGSTADSGSTLADSGPLQCQRNDECGADQLCGPAATCLPRCTEDGACVAHVAERQIAHLAANSQAIFFSTYPTVDGVGNQRSDGELWRMLPGQAPERVTGRIGGHVVGKFALQGDHAYFQIGKTIVRVLLQPGAEVQVVQELPNFGPMWVVGDSFIAAMADKTLLRGSLDGSVPLTEVITETSPIGPFLLADADRVYYAKFTPPDFFAFAIKSLRMVAPYEQQGGTWVTSPISYSSVVAARGPYVYYSRRDPYGFIERIDLRDGTLSAVSIRNEHASASTSSTAAGDWVYVYEPYGSTGGFESRLVRYSLVSIGTYQTVLPRRTDSVASAMVASVGSKLYLVAESGLGKLLYEMPLPPDP
jgi:hypothetical protein